MKYLRLALFTMVLGLFSGSARGQANDQAEIAFILMFGNDVRQVEATETPDDDAALANRFFEAAESGRNARDLTLRLYEKTYAFGILGPAGYEAANQALDRLMEAIPDQMRQWHEQRLALLEAWYEQGGDDAIDPEEVIDLYMRLADEAARALDADLIESYLRRGDDFARRSKSPRRDQIRKALQDLTRLRKVLENIEAAKARLATDPAAAQELAMLYLVHLDAPDAAADYAPQVQDAELKQHILNAATPFMELGVEATLSTALFYAGLAEDEDAPNRVGMLVRAMVWFTEFLSRDPSSQQAIRDSLAALQQIGDELSGEGIGRKLARKMASKIRGGGVFDRSDAVSQAIDKGVAWLYSRMDEERYWEQQPENHHNWGGYTALVVYALLMADEDPRTNRDLYRATNWMMNTTMIGIYPICFRIHAWEMLPQRERFRNQMTRDVGRLRQGMSREGFWGYRVSSPSRPGRLDVSTTLAGALGIWIGEESGGLPVPGGQWDRVARGMIEHQNADGGWTYDPAAGGASFGSMSAAGLAMLYAARPHVSDNLLPQVDESIQKGMAWMDANFSPNTNVNRGNWRNYYLAAVQHVGIFSNRKEFKNMDWYKSAEAHLLNAQAADGSWNNVQETAFAIAFLCRGGIQFDYSSFNEEADVGEAKIDDTVGAAE
ncbi:MAG: hypothetical protein AAGC44_09975 [Planctomycetota bacterium]